ncbi:Protein NARROW LEAF 1 [Linum perenne]
MDRNRLDLRLHHSGSSQSEESALDMERNYCPHSNLPWSSPSSLQPLASGGQHPESNAAYFSWPTLSRFTDTAEDRANYFGNLQKGVLPEILGRLPKVHRQWLSHVQCLPSALEGPGGVWCDVDVVEFSYFGAPAPTPKEQLYTELVDGLRGGDPSVGSGSQVANQETYGTLGAIVKSRTGNRQVGFLTNRHVAVDLDYPNQKMFHPLPPSLGPGVYLGAVERATSFITDELWYGIFAGTNPETFVRADGAFIPFAEDFNMNNVTTLVKGVGEIGDVHVIDLQSPINSLIGRQVMKVGRSSGLTTGTIMAYALEYNDEKGICFFTDFLVVGENQQTFDLEGDSGSLILLTGQHDEKPRPVGIIWGGTANRGRLKLKIGQPPENWTSGVDLGRLLDLLELDLITTAGGLQAAVHDQRNTSAAVMNSAVGESSSPLRVPSKDKMEESFEPFNLNITQVEYDSHEKPSLPPSIPPEFHIDDDSAEAAPGIEHQFIPSFTLAPLLHGEKKQPDDDPGLENLSALKHEGDMFVSLQLGEPEAKRRRQSGS